MARDHQPAPHPLAREIAGLLREAANGGRTTTETAGYLGSEREQLGLSVPQRRSVMKSWARAHRQLSEADFHPLLDGLYRGRTFEEIAAAGNVLELFPRLRSRIDLAAFGGWLEGLAGWCEIDCSCQSTFGASDLLDRWPEWDPFLAGLAASVHRSRRRAALVLLTKAVRQSPDPRLLQRSLANLRLLLSDRHPLITKAVSWLLRTLITHHRAAVERFLTEHGESLPAIAVRETKTKLATGRKTGPKRTTQAP